MKRKSLVLRGCCSRHSEETCVCVRCKSEDKERGGGGRYEERVAAAVGEKKVCSSSFAFSFFPRVEL